MKDTQFKPTTVTTHGVISPAIFYWGTPVVLISSENEDGTTNLAPMSSAWWLGNRCMLGLAAGSHTTLNILRTKQCVLNLASDGMAGAVNALARTTGTPNIDQADPSSGINFFKRTAGYTSVADKFGRANLTPQKSELVQPLRIAECPAQMEAELVDVHTMMKDNGLEAILALEVKVLRTHVIDEIRMPGHPNRIDPEAWSPLIMSFQELYSVNNRKLAKSELAKISEENYRGFSNPIEDGEGLPARP
jgi:flavin reductase (DIM6/NTAB) family NADH-FMN oxidoreductase RutF